MLRDAGMTNAKGFEELTIDECVFSVNMKNSRAELVNIQNRIDELAKEMACIPFNAEIVAFRFVEKSFPHRRLRKHVVTHNWQMVWSHRTMLEGDAHSFVCGNLRDGLPKLD